MKRTVDDLSYYQRIASDFVDDIMWDYCEAVGCLWMDK